MHNCMHQNMKVLHLSSLLLLCALSYTVTSAEDPIKNVHLIFMNHLDVGYSFNNQPGHIIDVLNAYFTVYFPRAVTVAAQLEVLRYRERFIYTTHPWLVSLYLDCPPNLWLSDRKLQCPDATNRSNFVEAIHQGCITWHAGPMNMEFEMLDESMMEFAIQLSMDLDKRFGIERKYRTVSQRDVPGTTQAILPILEKMGIKAVSIGVNGATAPADVPSIFNWKFRDTSMITMYHPGGYPNQYGPSPFVPGGMSRKDCVVVDGLDHALCFAFRSDNQGPPLDYKEVLAAFEIARSQFHNAIIRASTFEAFTELVTTVKDKLPVVTAEIGDVWIQGGGSDPRKTAELRAMYRARAQCLASGMCSLTDERVYNASRFMLKLSEHTWGSAGNSVDNIHWPNDQFYKLVNIPDGMYQNATYFWDEQRNFTTLALEALGDHPLAEKIQASLSHIDFVEPDMAGFKQVDKDVACGCGGFVMKFDNQGALIQLTDPAGEDWAAAENPVGKFVYQSYSAADFDKFFNATTPYSKHFFLGIGKPNMSKNAQPKSKIWDTKLDTLFSKTDSSSVIVHMSMADTTSMTYYGAPQQVIVQYSCSQSSTRSGIDITVQWVNKVPTRLPEGLNFVFMPVQKPGYSWLMNKIEEAVDPLNVVASGSQRLHGINRGVYYVDGSYQGMEIASVDSAIVNILTKEDFVSAIPLPLSKISSVTGVAYNMYNNVWETNYIFWYPYRNMDINQKFRFSLTFSSH